MAATFSPGPDFPQAPLEARTEGEAKPEYLMCSPRYFDTHFLFNPWMTFRERVNRHKATRQWRDLRRALEQAGAIVRSIDPQPDSSAMIFTADAALVLGEHVVLLTNDGPRGDIEPPLFRHWFSLNGYISESLPGSRLDGGNLVRLHDGSFAVGLKPGASGKAEAYLRKRIALTERRDLKPIGLVDRRYLHLDMVLGNVGNRLYIAYEDALYGGRSALPSIVKESEMIFIGKADAEAFAANLITIGDVVLTGKLSLALKKELTSHHFWVEELPLGEFYKAGGGAKCLTLPLRARRGGFNEKDENQPGSRGSAVERQTGREIQAPI